MQIPMLGILEASAIGRGCMGMTSTYSPAADTTHVITLIHQAHDPGVPHFDTAEAYRPLADETFVGEALAPIRDEVVIAPKFGFNIDPVTGERHPRIKSKPDHIRAAADPAVPIEAVAEAVDAMIARGKVLHFGLSEGGSKTIRCARLPDAVLKLTGL